MTRSILLACAICISLSIAIAGNSDIHSFYFDFGSSELNEQTKTELQELTKDLGDHLITIYGYTDHMGDRRSNLKLSENRIGSVETFLIESGFPDMLISSRIAEGEQKATSFTNDIDKNLVDRRVDLHITSLEFGDLNEMHDFCQKRNKEYFNIVVGEKAKITTESGNTIVIPDAYFDDLQAGTSLKVEVAEANNLSDFFIHRLSTVSDDGRVLETRGMMSVKFMDANGELIEREESLNTLDVEMNGDADEKGFQLFVAENDDNNVIDWSNTELGLSKNNRQPKYNYSLKSIANREIKFTVLKKPRMIHKAEFVTKIEFPRKPSMMRKPYKPTAPKVERMTLKGKTLDKIKSEKKRVQLQAMMDNKEKQYQDKLTKYEVNMKRYEASKVKFEIEIDQFKIEHKAAKEQEDKMLEAYDKAFYENEATIEEYLVNKAFRIFYHKLKSGKYDEVESRSLPNKVISKVVTHYARLLKNQEYSNDLYRNAYGKDYNVQYTTLISESDIWQYLHELLTEYRLKEELNTIREAAVLSSNNLDAIDNFYFSASRPNWYNIDRYMKMNDDEKDRLLVKADISEKVYVKVVEDNVFIELTQYSNTKGGYISPYLPNNKELQVIGTAIKDGTPYLGIDYVMLNNKNYLEPKLASSSLREILQKLNEIS